MKTKSRAIILGKLFRAQILDVEFVEQALIKSSLGEMTICIERYKSIGKQLAIASALEIPGMLI